MISTQFSFTSTQTNNEKTFITNKRKQNQSIYTEDLCLRLLRLAPGSPIVKSIISGQAISPDDALQRRGTLGTEKSDQLYRNIHERRTKEMPTRRRRPGAGPSTTPWTRIRSKPSDGGVRSNGGERNESEAQLITHLSFYFIYFILFI